VTLGWGELRGMSLFRRVVQRGGLGGGIEGRKGGEDGTAAPEDEGKDWGLGGVHKGICR